MKRWNIERKLLIMGIFSNEAFRDYLFAILFMLCTGFTFAYSKEREEEIVGQTYGSGDFKLVYKGQAADIYIEEGDYTVVRIAAADFSKDIERVTSRKPRIKHTTEVLSRHAVLIGTLGKSQLIERLMQSGKLDVIEIRGQWETFVQKVIYQPLPDVDVALVIVGSDRRGTAYGVYDLSEKIGVSPWYWWADVTPRHQETLVVRAGTYKQGPPSVKYRGIFINDEMWGIRPWAAKTFAPDEGMGLGPKTYSKIFELLLRLKANYIWPAMHRGTKPFNFYPMNKVTAEDYAIIMGSSHIEPMLRNNIGGAEWDTVGCGSWNYFTNRDTIYQYWKDRVKTNGMYENIYTIGMRGQDDQAMEGGNTTADKIRILEQVFSDQRAILKEEVNPDITKVPQVFVMYTEVLNLYNSGLQVPEDVIMCWTDDNFGYIRQLPDSKEQARPGGSGVYYHIQWLNGAPTAYTWLNTTPPALIWEEMSKAYEHNARMLWILNVGDIKPGEIGIEFFLRLAWDIAPWQYSNLHNFLVRWARREFGPKHAEDIANIMDCYYHLGYTRRPEHLVQLKNDELIYSWFSHVNFNDESQRRIIAYEKIVERAEKIYGEIALDLKDAYFQLVLYPVKCCSLMNQKVIYAGKSGVYAQQGRASATDYADKAKRAADEIDTLTGYYNRKLIRAGNKWEHFMALPGPWGAQIRQFDMPPLSNFSGEGPAQLGIALEGESTNELFDLSVYTKNRRFIDLFNKGKGSVNWKAVSSDSWILLSENTGEFDKEERIWVTIDWDAAPQGEKITGMITFSAGNISKDVIVNVFNPASPRPEEIRGFAESHGYICMEAEHYTNKIDRDGIGWEIIKGLGRSGDSVAIYPPTVPRRTAVDDILSSSPVLEYNMYIFHPGILPITIYGIPTIRINSEHGMRLAVSINDGNPKIVSYQHGNRDVLSNVMFLYSKCEIKTRGANTLKIWMVDPGVVIDKIVLDTVQPRDSYSGPPESYHN